VADVLTWSDATDAGDPVPEGAVAGLLRSLHDRSDGPGTIGHPMPTPHRAVIVL
jgi:hypothetical protein